MQVYFKELLFNNRLNVPPLLPLPSLPHFSPKHRIMGISLTVRDGCISCVMTQPWVWFFIVLEQVRSLLWWLQRRLTHCRMSLLLWILSKPHGKDVLLTFSFSISLISQFSSVSLKILKLLSRYCLNTLGYFFSLLLWCIHSLSTINEQDIGTKPPYWYNPSPNPYITTTNVDAWRVMEMGLWDYFTGSFDSIRKYFWQNTSSS